MSASKILFIDIETNGVNPNIDSIIEIAGVVCDWSGGKLILKEKFESLIKIDVLLDPIVTRITGIDDITLAGAEPQSKVRDRWAGWLDSCIDSEEGVLVVGHSIKEFDAKFLRVQNWYLPENHLFLDTLQLAKILLPQLSAVNLEYLSKHFGLSDHVSKILPETNLAPHRAMYDTLICCGLFEQLIQLITTYKLPQTHLDFIKPLFPINFIDLEYASLSSDLVAPSMSEEATSSPVDFDQSSLARINWNGDMVKPSISVLLNSKQLQHCQLAILRFQSKYSPSLPESLRLILAQLLVSGYISQKYTWKLKFHGPKSDITLAQALMEACLIDQGDIQPEPNSNANARVSLPLFEEIWWQIADASQIRFDLANLLFWATELSTMLVITAERKHNPLISELQKFDNAYHFFVLALQPFVTRGVYEYNPATMRMQEEVVEQRLGSVISCIEDLRFTFDQSNLSFSDPFGSYFYNQWSLALQKIQLDRRQKYTIQLRDNDVVLFAPKPGFQLDSHISNLIETFDGKLELPTYLNSSHIDDLIMALGLQRLASDLKRIITEEGDHNCLKSFASIEVVTIESETSLRHALAGLDPVGQTIMILGGSNRAILNIKQALIEDHTPDRFLIYGDSGSLTKIVSRLKTGYEGFVCLRQSDIWILKNHSFKKPINHVLLVGDYYFVINKIFEGCNYRLAKQIVNQSIKNRIKYYLFTNSV